MEKKVKIPKGQAYPARTIEHKVEVGVLHNYIHNTNQEKRSQRHITYQKVLPEVERKSLSLHGTKGIN